MFGLKKGKVENKLIEIKTRLDEINEHKMKSGLGSFENIPALAAQEINQEIQVIINDLDKVINLSQSLHKLVKREEAIQKIIDAQL